MFAQVSKQQQTIDHMQRARQRLTRLLPLSLKRPHQRTRPPSRTEPAPLLARIAPLLETSRVCPERPQGTDTAQVKLMRL